MRDALSPYADLTPATLDTLAAGRAADIDRGPTPLQRPGLRRFSEASADPETPSQ